MNGNDDHLTRTLVTDAWRVILFWLLGMIAFGIGMKLLLPPLTSSDAEMAKLLLSALCSSAVSLVLIYRASGKFSDQGFLTNMALRKGPKPWLVVGVLPAMVGSGFAYLATWLVLSRPVQPSTPLYDVVEKTQSTSLLLIFVGIATVVAPLIEEIIFRGYFFYVLRRAKGERTAVYCISLTFAFLHVGQYWGDWMAIGMVVLLGFALTLLRAKTQSTLASVIAHYLYNAGVTFIPVLLGAG